MAKNSDGTTIDEPAHWVAIESLPALSAGLDYAAFRDRLLRDIAARWGLPAGPHPRPCARCGIMLDPAFPGDAYCSQRCLDADRAAHAATVPTTDDDPDAEFPW